MATRTMVLLKHVLPTGEFHYDLMVQLGGPDAPLRTWRVDQRIDQLPIIQASTDSSLGFQAQPLGDHRAAYLDFEGDIGNNRGTVTRVAEGVVVLSNPDAITASDQALFDAQWTAGPNKSRRLRFYGGVDSAHGGGSMWRFDVNPI